MKKKSEIELDLEHQTQIDALLEKREETNVHRHVILGEKSKGEVEAARLELDRVLVRGATLDWVDRKLLRFGFIAFCILIASPLVNVFRGGFENLFIPTYTLGWPIRMQAVLTLLAIGMGGYIRFYQVQAKHALLLKLALKANPTKALNQKIENEILSLRLQFQFLIWLACVIAVFLFFSNTWA